MDRAAARVEAGAPPREPSAATGPGTRDKPDMPEPAAIPKDRIPRG